ncbi:hypothetical protein MTO96_000435 [Rhipicephalus appendiculatus]
MPNSWHAPESGRNFLWEQCGQDVPALLQKRSRQQCPLRRLISYTAPVSESARRRGSASRERGGIDSRPHKGKDDQANAEREASGGVVCVWGLEAFRSRALTRRILGRAPEWRSDGDDASPSSQFFLFFRGRGCYDFSLY